MKFVRALSGLGLLSLVTAAFAALTAICGNSGRPPSPDPELQTWRQHRPSAPQLGYFPEVIGELVGVVMIAAAGRIVFRLRLSPAPRSEGKPILLGLHRGRQDC